MRDADACNVIAHFLARRDAEDLESLPEADLVVVCGGSVLPVAYAAARMLQSGKAPRALITGGTGHATAELYHAIERHPFWGHALPPPRGRTEASVLRDLLLELGVAAGQLLPLEEASTNCGGNAELSMRLVVEGQGLRPESVIVLQDPTMQLRTHASFTLWWGKVLDPQRVVSFSQLLPRVRPSARAAAAGEGPAAGAAEALEFVPESVEAAPPASRERLQRWEGLAAVAGARPCGGSGAGGGGGGCGGGGCHALSDWEGVWRMDRYVSLLLGEVPRLRDGPGGYGPKGLGFIDRVDVPPAVEEAHAWLAGRYPHLLRA